MLLLVRWGTRGFLPLPSSPFPFSPSNLQPGFCPWLPWNWSQWGCQPSWRSSLMGLCPGCVWLLVCIIWDPVSQSFLQISSAISVTHFPLDFLPPLESSNVSSWLRNSSLLRRWLQELPGWFCCLLACPLDKWDLSNRETKSCPQACKCGLNWQDKN